MLKLEPCKIAMALFILTGSLSLALFVGASATHAVVAASPQHSEFIYPIGGSQAGQPRSLLSGMRPIDSNGSTPGGVSSQAINPAPAAAIFSNTLAAAPGSGRNTPSSPVTRTTPTGNVTIQAVKLATLSLDANGNGMADPDDEITYRILVSNTDTSDSPVLRIQDVLSAEYSFFGPPLVDLITPSLSTSAGTITVTTNNLGLTQK
jgi:uncharacterized repeat protein (TIGR01451 family)